MHGYALTLRIELVSESVLRLEEGSLYPALHRMTQAGWLHSDSAWLSKEVAVGWLVLEALPLRQGRGEHRRCRPKCSEPLGLRESGAY
jgi:hypothetical protein